MKISYAITVKDEIDEFKRLIELIIQSRRLEDEIIILIDNNSNKSQEINDLCDEYFNKYTNFNYVGMHFTGNFASWKNILNSKCNGNYIFQLDADEMLEKSFIYMLPQIIYVNNEPDLFYVPRRNTVEGLTQEWIDKWGWNVNENGYINYPDLQGRIYKNKDVIKWEGKVHEKIVGFKTYCILPDMFSLIHNKTIDKQIKQNQLYETI